MEITDVVVGARVRYADNDDSLMPEVWGKVGTIVDVEHTGAGGMTCLIQLDEPGAGPVINPDGPWRCYFQNLDQLEWLPDLPPSLAATDVEAWLAQP